jgi:uncharacterized protein YbjT (DUF2867 family)
MSTATTQKPLLVLGATGKQGGSLISSLLNSPKYQSDPFPIYAVTRDTASGSATRLSAKSPHITLIQGDLSNPQGIFDTLPSSPGSIFIVQPNGPTEEAEGKAIVNCASAAGTSYFIYASGDRGGPAKSENEPTYVKNLAAKYAIEKHIQKTVSASEGRMRYLILRPVTFMENISPDVHGKGFARMWQQMPKDKKLQVISTRDIGVFAAKGVLEPGEYANRAITLVGDELTFDEADEVFKEETGKSMSMTPCLMGSVIKWALKDTVGDLFQWLQEEGYGGDVQECKKVYPEIMDFRAWVKEASGFVELNRKG